MGLIFLPSQALIIPEEGDCNPCMDDFCYCKRLSLEDKLQWQAQQSPCGDDKLCDNDFQDVFGVELIDNGTFDEDASGWTLLNSVTYDAINKCVKFNDTTGAAQTTLKQNIPGITPGNKYLIELTIKDYIEGDISLYLLSNTPTNVITAPADITYQFIVTASSDLLQVFGVTTGGTTYPKFSIDDISVKEISDACWDFGIESGHEIGWQVTEDGLCHIPGETSTVFSQVASVILGKYYQYTITIKGSTTGGIELKSENIIEEISGNQTFVGYITPTVLDGLPFEIFPTEDFDGCISGLHFYEMTNDFTAELVQIVDGPTPPPIDITSSIEYYRQWVTISKLIGSFHIDYGKYTLKITDPCTDETYQTNCFIYSEENPCTRLLQGHADNEAFGFEFINTGFRLQERIECALNSSNYKNNSEDYIYSNGVRETHWAQSQKIKTLFIERVPEIVHDTIDLLSVIKHLFIGDANNIMKEYFVIPGDYVPEWPKSGAKRDAPARLELLEKDQVRFMNNAK